jgi:hypothetical protein
VSFGRKAWNRAIPIPSFQRTPMGFFDLLELLFRLSFLIATFAVPILLILYLIDRFIGFRKDR